MCLAGAHQLDHAPTRSPARNQFTAFCAVTMATLCVGFVNFWHTPTQEPIGGQFSRCHGLSACWAAYTYRATQPRSQSVASWAVAMAASSVRVAHASGSTDLVSLPQLQASEGRGTTRWEIRASAAAQLHELSPWTERSYRSWRTP
jgi:hypothetical protein